MFLEEMGSSLFQLSCWLIQGAKTQVDALIPISIIVQRACYENHKLNLTSATYQCPYVLKFRHSATWWLTLTDSEAHTDNDTSIPWISISKTKGSQQGLYASGEKFSIGLDCILSALVRNAGQIFKNDQICINTLVPRCCHGYAARTLIVFTCVTMERSLLSEVASVSYTHLTLPTIYSV